MLSVFGTIAINLHARMNATSTLKTHFIYGICVIDYSARPILRNSANSGLTIVDSSLILDLWNVIIYCHRSRFFKTKETF